MRATSRLPRPSGAAYAARALGIALFFLGAFLVVTRAAQAAPESPVDLEVLPAVVELCSDRTALVRVVARNKTNKPVNDLSFSATADAGVTAKLGDGALPGSLAGGAEAIALLTVMKANGPLTPGLVYLKLDYAADDVRRAALASFEVKLRAPMPAAQIARVDVKTAVTSLNEDRDGALYLVVTNTSSDSIDVGHIEVRAPSTLQVSRVEQADHATIEGGDARTFAFTIKTADAVRPGKHMLLFEVPLRAAQSGCAQTSMLTVSHEIDVGVFGESQILTALGVPSLFLLPGFLMLVAASLLWRLKVRPEGIKPDQKFPLPPKEAEFWMVAITLSLIIVFIPSFAGRALHGSYGLADLQKLWFVSVLAGAGIYVGLVAMQRAFVKIAAAIRSRRALDKDDPEIVFLDKLGRKKLGLMFPGVSARLDNVEMRMFRIEEAGGSVWVAPPIEVTWPDSARDLRDSLDRERIKSGDASRAAEILRRAVLEGAKVRWASPGGPRCVPKADVGQPGSEECIVQESA